MTNKKLLVSIGVLLAIGMVVGWFTPNLPKVDEIDSSFGAVGNMLAENYIPYVMYNQGFNTAKGITNSGAFTQGSAGTSVQRINAGNCNIASSATTIAASTTVAVSCHGGTTALTALTGVAVNDIVYLQFATSSVATDGGLRILGASASSTQGYIHVIIHNAITTGTAFTWTTAASSSLNYIAIDPS